MTKKKEHKNKLALVCLAPTVYEVKEFSYMNLALILDNYILISRHLGSGRQFANQRIARNILE